MKILPILQQKMKSILAWKMKILPLKMKILAWKMKILPLKNDGCCVTGMLLRSVSIGEWMMTFYWKMLISQWKWWSLTAVRLPHSMKAEHLFCVLMHVSLMIIGHFAAIFSVGNHTFQGCSLHHFCIFNRNFRRKMAFLNAICSSIHKQTPFFNRKWSHFSIENQDSSVEKWWFAARFGRARRWVYSSFVYIQFIIVMQSSSWLPSRSPAPDWCLVPCSCSWYHIVLRSLTQPARAETRTAGER